MTILKTRDSKGLKFTGTCNDVVSIDDVIEHSANKVWRTDSEKSVVEEKNDLLDSINSQGLREAITMYEDSKIIISGHTRIEQLRKLGVLEVPVIRLPRTENMPAEGEIDPMHKDVLNEHAISNTRVGTTPAGRYLYAREIIASREVNFNPQLKAKDQVSRNVLLKHCKQAGVGPESFDHIEGLRFGYTLTHKNKDYFVEPRLDLFDDLKNPEKDYPVRKLSQMQKQDFVAANLSESYHRQDFMDDALEELDFESITKQIKSNLDQIQMLAGENEVYDSNWFDETDDNYISATIHHIICSYICIELNKTFTDLGFEEKASQGRNQSHYDVHIMDRDNNIVSTIEVKTTKGKSTWNSGSNKTGYNLLFAYNKERDRFFAVSTYIENGDWEGGVKGKFTLSAETVHNKEEKVYYMGDIEKDDDVYRIQKYKL
ncbi:hypothetical protein N9J02_01440 [bacterium]|nr:hypothetical protein [bacterium]